MAAHALLAVLGPSRLPDLGRWPQLAAVDDGLAVRPRLDLDLRTAGVWVVLGLASWVVLGVVVLLVYLLYQALT